MFKVEDALKSSSSYRLGASAQAGKQGGAAGPHAAPARAAQRARRDHVSGREETPAQGGTKLAYQ